MEVKNFTLLKTEEVKETGSMAYFFEHNKTKAQIIYLSNPNDDNKVFNICFKTVPTNDKGIPHIIEHSVLNGSRKFPSKEPFAELIKGSLNTFLNAMTYNDKTCYPVASRNKKDFRNLTDVYLDAVFYPRLKTDPFTLKQEGWHYELDDINAQPTFKGVVFNEMKGAYSSPDRFANLYMERVLFPDNTYSCESGGYPTSIVDLTQEEFVAFHDRFYHPSNARVFYYGDGDIADDLAFLDSEYLSHFEYRDPNCVIPVQKPFAKPVEIENCYPSATDDPEGAILYEGFVLPPMEDAVDRMAFSLLGPLLMDSNDSPVRKALLKAGIGKEISSMVDTGTLQPFAGFYAKDARAEDKDRFVAIIREEIEKLVANGFDDKFLLGNFNTLEFSLRENDFGSAPKGLIYGLSMLDTWLYDMDPLLGVCFEEPLQELRKLSEEKGPDSFWGKFLKRVFLDNNHCAMLVVKPDSTMSERMAKEENDRLAADFARMTDAEKAQLVEDTRIMKERQLAPDKPEDLAKIPLLNREDLDKKPVWYMAQKENNFIKFNTFTNGIAYVDFNFDLTHEKPEDLPYIGILSLLLGDVDCDGMSYGDFENECKISTGDLSTKISVYENIDTKAISAFLTAGVKYLYPNQDKALKLAQSMLLKSDFSDKKHIKELLAEYVSGTEMSLQRAGHRTASHYAASMLSKSAYLEECMSGLSFYLFAKELVGDFDNRFDALKAKLEALVKTVFVEDKLSCFFTIEEKAEASLKKALNELQSQYGKTPASKENLADQIVLEKHNVGIKTPGQVQYVGKVGMAQSAFNGSAYVFSSIVSKDYLWNNVRLKGGAYGCMHNIARSGMVTFVSYRDPNLEETLKVYDAAYDEFKKLEMDERTLLKFIIGTVSDLSPVLEAKGRGKMAFSNYMTGNTEANAQNRWNELLATDVEALRKAAELVREAFENAVVVVEGSKAKIEQAEGLFDTYVEI